jgi:hypothetical protein
MQIPAAVGRVLQKLEPNTRASIRAAESQARDEIREADSAPVRCALARVLVEDWRNGWDELADPRDRTAVLRKALESLDMAFRRRESSHWYVDCKRGYVLRYAARALGRPDFVDAALQSYRDAYEKLSSFCGLPPRRGEKALRSLLVDWAETLVYFGDVTGAMQNFEFTQPWHRRVPDDWHEWAHAFALHQQGDYEASWRKMEPLVAQLDSPYASVEPAHANTLIAPRAKKKVHASYYNDMRLMLAASYARDKQRDKAQQQIDKFQQFRRLSGEQPWTVSIEAERGAFIEGSAGETHWLGSLAAAGLPKGEPAQKAKTVHVAAAPGAKTGVRSKSRAGAKSGTKRKTKRAAKRKPAGVKPAKSKRKSVAKSRSKSRAGKKTSRKKSARRSKRRTKAKSNARARRGGRAARAKRR